MDNEKLKILEMIQQGKITAAEGMDLLKAIEETIPLEKSSVNNTYSTNMNGTLNATHFLRVRVDGEKTPKVNVNIPMSLVKSATRLANIAMAFIPSEAKGEIEQKGINLEELLNELIRDLEQGVSGGKLVDVDVDDPHEGRIKVEVFVD